MRTTGTEDVRGVETEHIAYQCAGAVDAEVARLGAVHPLRLAELPEAVFRHIAQWCQVEVGASLLSELSGGLAKAPPPFTLWAIRDGAKCRVVGRGKRRMSYVAADGVGSGERS